MDWQVFTGRVLTLYVTPLRARSTHAGMSKALEDFAAATGVVDLEQLDTESVARFVGSRVDGNANTTRSKLRYLRTATNVALEEGWLARGPRWSRLWPRATPARRTHLDHDQVARLLTHLARQSWRSWVDHRLYALASIVAYTGLRRNEALYLRVEDVRLSERFLVVSGRRRLKTESSAAPVPIPPELWPILGVWLPRCGCDWVFPGRLGKGPWVHATHGYRPMDKLRDAGEDCGVPGVTFHGLRHTLAKLMVGKFGLTADQARSVLRHSSVATTEAYYLHRDDLACLDAIGRSITFRPVAA